MDSGKKSTQDRPLTVMNLISGDGKGGADRLALDLSIGLQGLGHRVIWGSPPDCFLTADAIDAGIEIYNTGVAGPASAPMASRLVQFCRDERVDVVDGHNSLIRHLISLARLRGLRARVVSTRHCIHRTIPFVGAFAHNFLADMNIAVSRVVRESLIRGGVFPWRAITVYGGIDTGRFGNASEQEVDRLKGLYTRRGTVTIGMVARLQHGKTFGPDKPTLKGHDIAFRALAGFDRDFTLLLFGPEKEEDKDKLRRVATHNGFDPARITFCGFQRDMAPFYRILDVNILPSPNEGLGLAVIEAMVSGVPSIGVDKGGIREVIDDGADGFLARPGDSADLLRKICVVCDDLKIRERFVANGIKKARQRFGRDRMAHETETVYRHLFKQRMNQ